MTPLVYQLARYIDTRYYEADKSSDRRQTRCCGVKENGARSSQDGGES